MWSFRNFIFNILLIADEKKIFLNGWKQGENSAISGIHTGWQSISEIKYCLTVTSFWVLVTFWAYRRLTRCGPFDKIALWSLLMPIWDHLSLVSKETIFRRCTNFSDFCNIWKTISDDNSQKNWMTQWFMRMMECFLLTANHE